MDQDRFDALARALASGRSRRGLLQGLGAAALGALGLRSGDSEARALRSVGDSCKAPHDCASNFCVNEGHGRKICHCRSVADCPAAQDVCHSAACLPSGYCALSVNAGAPCDDHNACTQTDACDSQGRCVGSNPVVCPTHDQCHLPGTCNPANGSCSNPAKADGSSCGAGQQCCGGICCPNAVDVCVAGACCTPDGKTTTCAGKCGTVANNCGQNVDCGACAPEQCLTCGPNHTCVSTCTTGQACCGGACKQDTGSTCASDPECCSGVCVAGVCQAGCVGLGGQCSDSPDCCDGHNCVGVSNGVGVCCAGALACGGTCCQADTVCTKASCAGNACSYTTTPGCCLQDGDCPTPTDPCQQAVCDLATNTCGTTSLADDTTCGTSHQCCGGSCVDVASDPKHCGGCGSTCTANAPCNTGGISLPGCCETGTCTNGSCDNNGGIFCASCATATCDPVKGPTCHSNCPPSSTSDLCHAGPGLCQPDGSCTAGPTCSVCETCDPSTGACSPKTCGGCEICDPGTGLCLPGCPPCQTCDNSINACVSSCNSCESCDPDSKQCVPHCPNPPVAENCESNRVVGCGRYGFCQYETCGTCQSCNGSVCSNSAAGAYCNDYPNNPCWRCDGFGNCVASPAGTPCANGTCHVCDGAGSCGFAAAGSACGDGQYDCDATGNCSVCHIECGRQCCAAGSVACCVGSTTSVCCASVCVPSAPGQGDHCPGSV